jgi:diguanylate cyclase (GGDEF)-like protein/PAS domain S-box-containing protein
MNHASGARRDNEALWEWNLDSNRIHYSPRWIALLGCQEHEIATSQTAWLERVHPDDREDVSRTIESHLISESGEFDVPHRILHKDGTYRWMSCRGVVHRDAAGKAVRVMGAHADLTADTVTDPLTGLPNRLLFLDRLARSVERATRYPGFHYSVLLIDLDRAIEAEDPAHTPHKDPLLNAAARRLETSLRTGNLPPTLRHNDLVARLQGDQFAILLDGLKEVGHAKVAAERILEEMLAPFTVNGRDTLLTASMGVAVSATGYTRADDVLRDAETALHRAKLLGKARCEIFDTAALASAQTELLLEADLAPALERREFQLFYQPIVSLASNEIVGLEALLRWQHPVLGLIPPGDFVPIAERTGFIVPLGLWVLREACVQLQSWKESGSASTELWVSVNVSSLQFNHPGLIGEISSALHDSGLDPRCLVLELTESAAMQNPTAVKELLMQLRAMGIRVSVDDFGTGHSSLATLRQLPADSLKVDRSFVRGIEGQKGMMDILGAVTTMARQLGLHVVAEGIEKEEQRALVQSLGCQYGQGFLFARPLDHERTAEFLKTGVSGFHVRAENEDVSPALVSHKAITSYERLTTRRTTTMKALYAAAAVVALIIVAGLPATFRGSKTPVEAPRSHPASAAAPETPAAAAIVNESPKPVAPVPIVVTRPQALPESSSPLNRLTPATTPPAKPGAAPRAAVAPKPAPTPAAPPARLEVVHQHRLGNCRGVLVASEAGVAFVPDSAESNDRFDFKHGQYLHAMDDDSLAIKTHDRTYRFKAASNTAGRGNRDQLERLMASISGFQQLTAARQ